MQTLVRYIKPTNGGHEYSSIPFEKIYTNYMILDAYWNIHKVVDVDRDERTITIRLCDEYGNIFPNAVDEYMQFE